jgi:hypothetical protein
MLRAILRLIVIAALLMPRAEAFATRPHQSVHPCCVTAKSCPMMKRLPAGSCQWNRCESGNPQRTPRAAEGRLSSAPLIGIICSEAFPFPFDIIEPPQGVAMPIDHPPRRA